MTSLNFSPLGYLGKAYRWLCETEGSTRAVALIRMAIVANAWARWSDEHVIYRNLDPETVVVGLLFFFSSTLTFFGLFTRVASLVFAATTFHFVYVVGHLRGHEPYVHHHTTLLAWAALLVALSPAGRSLSIDRWLSLRRAERRGDPPPPEIGNLWAQRLMVVQISSVYVWGAIDKSNLAFASGARMTHYLMYYYTGPTELTDISPLLAGVMPIAGALTLALEWGLGFGLFFRRTRRWLVIPGLLLHGAFYFALSVFTFTTTMWALYLACFEPDEVDAAFTRLLGATPTNPKEPPQPDVLGPAQFSVSSAVSPAQDRAHQAQP